MTGSACQPMSASPNGLMAPEAVSCTDLLARRSSRPPDYETQARAQARLAQALADAPRTVLQTLAETIFDVLQAGSAGISVLTADEKSFVWPAIAGAWHARSGGGAPRDASPCGEVLDRNAPLLVKHPQQRYPGFSPAALAAQECLLHPFYLKGKTIGTVWAVTHDERRKFDAEDLRQLESLGSFASAAWQAAESMAAAPVQAHGALSVRDRTERTQADQALRHGRAQPKALIDEAPIGVFVIDDHCRICQANPVTLKLLPRQPDPIGSRYDELMHSLWPKVLADELVERYRHTLETGQAYLAPEMIEQRLGQGKARYYEWQFNRISQADGRHSVVCYFREISERILAQQQIRDSKERYRDLFNSIDEGFCIIEMLFDENDKPIDYRFVEVNAAFEKQSAMHDVVGKRAREILPDLEDSWFDFYGQVALTDKPMRIVSEVKSLDRWLDIYATRLGRPENRQLAIFFNNVTERMKAAEALRQSEARFRALFDSGPVAMYSCDTAGKIQEFNRNAVVLWGREPKPEETAEQFRDSFKFFLPNGAPLPGAQTGMTRLLGGEIASVHDMEFIIERPDGSRSAIIANIVPLKNAQGEITGAINCMYDITERSRLERKTQEQAQALAELHSRKDEFLAMLSHELRNPLAPIDSAVQLLRLQKSQAPLEQQALQVIERQVGQLKHLVDELLEVSRITSGKIQLRAELTDMGHIVQRAVETARPLIVQRRHEFTVSLPPQPVWLQADATRLEQVLVNLLTNAAKYTDEGGRIWLSVEQEGAAGPAPMAVVKVRDSGIGITPELLPHIFELFTQAERSIDRSQGGLGIGLSLVRQLVELHGGRVEARSVPGQGSEFVVCLPVVLNAAPPPLPAQPAAQPAQPPDKGCRVLAVDDNVDAVQSLAMLLKISGHEVQIAYDGLEALNVALAMRPDVVLLDIGLPGLTGLEVAEQIRQQPALNNTMLVALTGYGKATDRQLSQEAGFDYHLVKPARFSEIEKILAIAAEQMA